LTLSIWPTRDSRVPEVPLLVFVLALKRELLLRRPASAAPIVAAARSDGVEYAACANIKKIDGCCIDVREKGHEPTPAAHQARSRPLYGGGSRGQPPLPATLDVVPHLFLFLFN